MDSSSVMVPAEGMRFAVNEDGQELGHAYLYLIKNDGRSSPCGLMEDVFVAESARSKGVGTKLVKLVIEEAKKRGCYKLLGTSRYARPEVHAWYEKLGFKDYGKEFRMDF
jgi:GNAT superfamily N-acetyltransferase